MKLNRLYMAVFLITSLMFSFTVQAEEDPFKGSAMSWQKQATDTRAKVIAVYEELTAIGDKGNATAKELIDDAVVQLGEGDKKLKEGDVVLAKDNFQDASSNYNMAWQYYVKAATAGLNAKRILTGQ